MNIITSKFPLVAPKSLEGVYEFDRLRLELMVMETPLGYDNVQVVMHIKRNPHLK